MTATDLEQLVKETKKAISLWNTVIIGGVSGIVLVAALQTLSCPSGAGPCTMGGLELVVTTALGGIALAVMVIGIMQGKRLRQRLVDAQFYLLREARKR
ncbi:MAG: hypothetical protein KGJ23_11340 [Euryarchaeota archaeon]|nr:hypothetical protein [Euryarchaeota archaeon]MDE1837188.1 hypothetical protein [Euryarchaeota archaeon]MDE1881686.1 hypothetical protein [Euryarchaeota archaeon]MDE2045344.1 hypothetical protein [Thermoplasmata archaeon]